MHLRRFTNVGLQKITFPIYLKMFFPAHKKAPKFIRGLINIFLKAYIKSKARAKEVITKGNTIEQYPPATAYTPKKAATDTKNIIQYFALDFFTASIIFNCFCKYKTEV